MGNERDSQYSITSSLKNMEGIVYSVARNFRVQMRDQLKICVGDSRVVGVLLVVSTSS